MHPLDTLFDTRLPPAVATPAQPTPLPPGGQVAAVAMTATATMAGDSCAAVVDVLPSPPSLASPVADPLPPLPPGVLLSDLPDAPDTAPCPRCGSLAAWWDLSGRQRCQWCDPDAAAFRRGLRLMQRTERIWARANAAAANWNQNPNAKGIP